MNHALSPDRSPGWVRWLPAVETALVLVVFALYGAAPIPDSNEPHYLVKARHYWNPEWCHGDFFLATADAHAVFYYSFGWLSRWLSLEEMAFWGRLLTWGLLAWSWRRMSVAIVPKPFFAVWTAALFITLLDHFDMAGEWVVGGVEAKGFAFVLVFLAIEALVRDQWNRALLLLGGATSMHVLVGGWAGVATGIAWLGSGSARPSLKSLLPGIVGGALLAMPGLWSTARMTLIDDQGIDANEAHCILVFERLPHHLSPLQMRPKRIALHLTLWGVWLLLCWLTPATAGVRRLRWLVAGAMMIAAIGLMAAVATRGHPDLGAGILRFYWFRLSDVMAPLGATFGIVLWIVWLRQTWPVSARCWFALAMALPAMFLVRHAVHNAFSQESRADTAALDEDAWRDVCHWAADNSPLNARFLNPRFPGTFHWYANRAEVGNWKDVPQDSRGVIQWWRRMNEFHATGDPDPENQWRESMAELGAPRLRQLAEKYKVDYIIVEKVPDRPPLDWPAEYENKFYAVLKTDRAPGAAK